MDASPLFPPLEVPLLGVSSFAADRAMASRLHAAARSFAHEGFAREIDENTRRRLNLREPRVHLGDVASGDRFVSTNAHRDALRATVPSALCVEMEGAAVAQVCHEQAVSFAVVRTISDIADDRAATDFGQFVTDAASRYGLGILRNFLATPEV